MDPSGYLDTVANPMKMMMGKTRQVPRKESDSENIAALTRMMYNEPPKDALHHL